jgi:hypothetical protein
MNKTFQTIKKYNYQILIFVFWAFLWLFPWAIWLNAFPWVRIALALVSFILPGMAGSMFLIQDRFTLMTHFVGGLALSISLTAVLGLAGRIFHLPFAFIKPVFILAGSIFLLLVLVSFSRGYSLYKPQKITWVTWSLLFGMMLYAFISSVGHGMGDDDFTYLAYLTNWQHAQSLNFNEVVLSTGGVEGARFWSAMFPVSMAFLASISNVHGLLFLAYYIEPFIVVIALLSIYNLYEDVLQNAYLSIAALIVHFSFFLLLYRYRQIGHMLFVRASEDKVFMAFVMAPVFFMALRYLCETINFRSVTFFILVGWGAALTHPIILTYAIIISGLYAFTLVFQRYYKKFAVVILLLGVVILPSASLRFVETPWVAEYIFDLDVPVSQPGSFDLESARETVMAEDIISFVDGTPFYGFNLDKVKIRWESEDAFNQSFGMQFFSFSFLWVLGLAFLWSLFNLNKKSAAAPFLAASALLVLIGAIPYTGWLLGYLVSARMLWRTPWLFPIGMAGVVLINELLRFIFQYVNRESVRRYSTDVFTLGLVLALCLPLFASEKRWERLPALANQEKQLQKFVDLGNFLENEIEQPSVFAAPRTFSDYLPGISSKPKVVFFRHETLSPIDVKSEELDMLFLQDDDVSIAQRMNVLRKYKIQYIVVDERFLRDYYAAYPEIFSMSRSGTFSVIKFLEAE